MPLKIVITSTEVEKNPRFLGRARSSSVVMKSSFIHVGSYVTTVMAVDPTSGNLIDDYSIVSQVTTPSSEKSYFKIDKHSG